MRGANGGSAMNTCEVKMSPLNFFKFQGGNGSSPVRGLPPVIRSPQNSHSHSTQGTAVGYTKIYTQNFLSCSIWFHPIIKVFYLLLQVRQNSSSPTSLSFGDHMTHPKQLALKFVQVREVRDWIVWTVSALFIVFKCGVPFPVFKQFLWWFFHSRLTLQC